MVLMRVALHLGKIWLFWLCDGKDVQQVESKLPSASGSY